MKGRKTTAVLVVAISSDRIDGLGVTMMVRGRNNAMLAHACPAVFFNFFVEARFRHAFGFASIQANRART